MWRTCAVLALILGGGDAAARGPGQRDDCGLEPPAVALGAPPVAKKRAEQPGDPALYRGVPAVAREGFRGVLSGKAVYLSPGHGFTWSPPFGWRTQRGNTNDIVEDLVSAEAVDQYVATYLRNMGAFVVTVRESDLNPEQVVVDDTDAVIEGIVAERPMAETEVGWGAVTLPITSDAVNPFRAGGTRLVEVSAAETGRVVYPAAIPATGFYHVYASWAQGPDRAADAHYVVRHSGGEAHFRVDQRRHGQTWVFLGRFHFEAGAPPERAAVAVANDATTGTLVSLDAVRLGGGVGVIDRGGGTSGRPMYENSARYYAQLAGADPEVFTYAGEDRNDDVGTRSRFTRWEHPAGEDAVYLAWHTNAPNPARGTDTYTYASGQAPPGPISAFDGVPGSLELQAAVHDEIVGDIRAAWDPAWQDRGKHTAYFGEVNPTHNPETPAVLVEVAFHDTPADADAIRDPRFRRLVARAMAQGIARYFADKDGTPLALPPEPPAAVRVENDGQGGLRVSWRPPAADVAGGDPPAAYRVYTSPNGYGFDEGTEVAAEATTLAGLAPGAVVYVRVAAVNAGGESLPSEVVGARVAAGGQAPVLVVGGFDRLDGALLPREDLGAFDLAVVDRMWLDRMNDGTYAARHGAAVAGAGRSFDGASDEAISAGDVDLAAYRAVDWFLGEESSGDEPFDAAARDALRRYLLGGGRLLVTGAEIGWALDFRGTPEEQAFYHEVLHAAYAADDAETYAVRAAGPSYDGLAELAFDDPARGAYDAEWPDTLVPGAGAAAALEYVGGVGGTAAVAWEGGVMFGFPFETIAGADVRREVMARTLDHLGVPPDPAAPDAGAPGVDAGNPDDGGGGCCGCRAAGARGRWQGPGFVVLTALGLLVLRRRRPRNRRPWQTANPSFPRTR